MKSLVFPEGDDSRVIEACSQLIRDINCILLTTGTLNERLETGMKMVVENKADGLITGATHPTRDTLLAAFKYIGLEEGVRKVSSGFLFKLRDKTFYFADCAVQINPTVEELVEIARLSARNFERITKEKARIALLSYSTLGSANGESALKMREVAKRLGLIGELQADAALVPEVFKQKTRKELSEPYNVFIFPNLDAGNICYKMVERLAGAKATGPILQGLKKPVHDLSRGCSVQDIVDLARIAVL